MNMMKLVYVGILATSFMAVGCGGLRPLTAEEKAQVKATMDSTGRSVNVPRDLSPAKRKNRGLGMELGSVAPQFVPMTRYAEQLTASPASIPSRSDEDYARMRRRLEAARNCKAELVSPPSSSVIPEFHLRLVGTDCPATLDLNLSIKPLSERDFEVLADCRYQVTDAEYRTYNDIDGMDIKGNARMTMTGTERDAKGKVSLDISGKLHSQKHGDVGLKIFGNAEGQASVAPSTPGTANANVRGEMAIRFDYPSFAAELRIKGEGEKIKYLINGEDVSEADFMAFFESMSSGF